MGGIISSACGVRGPNAFERRTGSSVTLSFVTSSGARGVSVSEREQLIAKSLSREGFLACLVPYRVITEIGNCFRLASDD